MACARRGSAKARRVARSVGEAQAAAAVETAPIVSAAKWVHVAVRRDGLRVDLLINGALSATATGDAGIVDLANTRHLLAGLLAGTDAGALHLLVRLDPAGRPAQS